MRTTLDLDDELLAKAQNVTGIKMKTQVIELGLRALIENHARQRLALLGGSIPNASAPGRRSSVVKRSGSKSGSRNQPR